MRTTAVLSLAIASLIGLSHPVAAQQVLRERLKITAPDAAAGDAFGHAVSLDGGRVLVGAVLDDDGGTDTGSAYLFDVATGAFRKEFRSPAQQRPNRFLQPVALRQDIALLGIPDAFNTGAVAVFDGDGNQTDLLQPFAPPTASTEFSNFGYAVGLAEDGRHWVVGARGDTGEPGAGANGGGGAMYLYDAAGGARKVFASDADIADNFGSSVAISTSFAVGSSPFDGIGDIYFGSIYVFDVATATETLKLAPADVAAGDQFGSRVAIQGSLIAASSLFHDAAGPDAGAVYLFDAVSGEQLQKLTVPGTRLLGAALALDGHLLAVGAQERAFVFDVRDGHLIAELSPSDATGAQSFGGAIAIEGDTVVVGAQRDSARSTGAGAVYVYDVLGDDPPLRTVSVQALQAGVYEVSTRSGRLRQGAEVDVMVADQDGLPVADARITVQTQGRIEETLTGTSDATGRATLRSEATVAVRRRPLTYSVCVLEVEGAFVYDAQGNVITCAAR